MARAYAALLGVSLWLAGWPILAGGASTANAAAAGDGGQRFFDRLDLDGNGVVSFDEMRVARDRWVAAVDANRDGRISRAEFLSAPPRGRNDRVSPLHHTRRARIFKRIDMNGDGFIDVMEREASLKRWFARRDTDADGRLSLAELRAARARWQAWRGTGPHPGPRARAGGREGAKRDGWGGERRGGAPSQGFRRFDRNADGAVSFAELSAARATRMHAIDRNRDGRVSYDEFVRAAPGGADGRRGRRRARLFPRIDRNRDGYITPEEHALALRGWFARMDTDGDGLVTEAEITAARARRRARRRSLGLQE